MTWPSVSLIIPTYDRPTVLRASLHAIAGLEYPSDRWEVIVVDDGSSNPVGEAVAPFRQRLSLTLVRQANQGPATARNTGAQEADGTLLAFTDDDCRPMPSWLRCLVEAHQSAPGAMVGGRTVNALSENPYSTVSELLVQFLRRRHQSQPHRDAFFASNNLLVPADRFRELEGFDTGFPLAAGEDRDFCLRWAKQEWPSTYAPDAVLRHAHSLTLKGFVRQHFTYGRGAFHVHRKHAARQQSAQRSFSFYRDLITYPLDEDTMLRSGGNVLLMAGAQAATAAGYAIEATRHNAFSVLNAGPITDQESWRTRK